MKDTSSTNQSQEKKEVILWEEKNLTELEKNCSNSSVPEAKDTTINIKNELTSLEWRNITPENLKKCPKCKSILLKINFHKNKSTKDGLNAYCKVCTCKDNNLRWENNKEKILAKNKEYYNKNKEIHALKAKIYRENNVEMLSEIGKRYRERPEVKVQTKKRSRTYELSQYGITEDIYSDMFNSQNGCCAICGIHQSELTKKLNIDHNHTTDKVRALLCGNCNRGLGIFKENINSLKSAVKYLNKYKQ
jgi:hypothetical protein